MMLDRDVRVSFLGDSYVAGIGDSSALGWTGRLAAAAASRGLHLTPYNLGIRGDTSVMIARRAGAEVAARSNPSSDSRVVLSFGVNDTALIGRVARVQPEAGLEAFDRIRRVVGVPLLLVGPPAVHEAGQDDRLRRLNGVLQQHCRDLAIPFVDVFAATAASELWRREIEAGDHFHPDAAGYAFLASVVAEPVLDWLATPSSA